MHARRLSLSILLTGALLGFSACGSEEPGLDPTEDAGWESELDAALAGEDAGVSGLDAGADAGENPSDAALPGADAALPGPDAGDPSADAGSQPYAQLDSLPNSALEAAIYDLVKDHISLNYDNGSKIVMTDPGGFDVFDGKVECLYTGVLFDPSQRDAPGSEYGFNMEHSWPKSEGAGTRPAESDLHHLFPTEKKINSARSSYNFGETSCTTSCKAEGGGSKFGPIVGGTELVFQVRPERQGDIARAHFYFAVRYRMNIPDGEEATLRRWNVADPPDDRERARNLAIEKHQKKRNPFVERPDFVDRIADF